MLIYFWLFCESVILHKVYIIIIREGNCIEYEQFAFAYVLSVDEKYWNRLCQRDKVGLTTHVFIRKNAVTPFQVNQLLFYVTAPDKRQVLGVANFLECLTGNSADLWKKFGSESCFENLWEYKTYTEGKEMMTFIRFNNFKQIKQPKTKDETVEVLGMLHRFSIGQYLDRESALRLI